MKSTKILPWFLLLFILILFWHLGNWGVTETSEARYAEISREILTSGNWFMPKLLGIFHFDKPLMTYWITAIGMKIFGINPFGARFFLSIAYLIQLLLVYKIARQLFNNTSIASYTAILYAGTLLVLMATLNLTTDAFLNTFELLAVYVLIHYYRSRKPGSLYLFFLVLGLAIQTKGPVGILLPTLMIYPVRKMLQVEGRKNNWHVFLGIILMLAIGGSWFFYLMIKSHKFYHFFIGQQLFDRMFKASELKRSKPFWYYLVLFPAVLLPYFILIPEAISKALKQRHRDIILILLFGVAIPFIFFSISSSKLILYVLPLVPYAVLTEAWFIEKSEWNHIKKYYYYIIGGFYLLLLLGLLMALLGYISGFSVSFSILNWILLLAGLGILVFSFIKKKKAYLVLMALLMPLCVVPISKNIMADNEIIINSTAPIADFIQKNNLANRKIIVWNTLLPSLSFELQENIYSVYYTSFYLKRNTVFQENENWKKWLINVNMADQEKYLQQLVASPSVFIVKKGHLPQKYQNLIQDYPHKKDFGRWLVYY